MADQEQPPDQLYPQVGIRLNRDQFVELWHAAARQHFRTTKGKTEAGALLRVLVGIVWPILREANFDAETLEDVVSRAIPDRAAQAGETHLKDWFWDFYRHLPPDSRHDIIRGLSDRFNFSNPPRVHVPGEAAETEERDQDSEENPKLGRVKRNS